jgi:peroxiredoxin
MKKYIYLLVFIVYIPVCLAQKPHYEITGKIMGAEGVTFTLQKIAAGQIIYLDTAIVVNGMFKMTGGPVEYPEVVNLVTQDKRKQLSFFLENSIITITGKLDSLNSAKISGSKTQDELNSLINEMKPLEDRYNALSKDYQAATKAKDTQKISSLTSQIDGLMAIAKTIEKNFVINNPSSFAAPAILAELVNGLKATEIESIINSMSPEVAKTQVIIDIKSNLMSLKKVDIGQKAPDFSMNDPKGNKISLASKVGSKLLLVDFWAGWCSPCRQENPNVVKVYREFHSKGFEIIGVSLDQTEAQWKKAIADDNLTWTHVSDLKYWNNEAARLYSVRSIPANFLLDKDGIIIAKDLRGEELYNKVKEVVNSK